MRNENSSHEWEKRNKGPGQGLSIISLIIQSTTGNWGAEYPQSLRKMEMKTCHGMPYGEPLPGPTSPDLSAAKTKMAGQWQRLEVGLKAAITNIHPRREEVCILLYPNVYFFLVGVCNRSKEFSLLQSCYTSIFPFSFGNLSFMGLCNEFTEFPCYFLFWAPLSCSPATLPPATSSFGISLPPKLYFLSSPVCRLPPDCWFCCCYCYYYYRKYLVKQLELKDVSRRER